MKKGLKATLTKTGGTLTLDVLRALAQEAYASEGMKSAVSMAIANIAECETEENRLGVAQEVLASMMIATLNAGDFLHKCAFFWACDRAWGDFVSEYVKYSADDEWEPSPLWVRHAFAHEHAGQVRIGHPLVTKAFVLAGFGTAKAYLDPEHAEWASGYKIGVLDAYAEVA